MDGKVVVAGGGPAGTVAAIAAARGGARTILVERGEAIGGVATSGGLSVWGPFDDGDRLLDWDRDARIEAGLPLSPEMAVGNRVIKGIPQEILDRLLKMGGAIDYTYGFIPVNPECLKLVLEEMVLQAGGEIMYGAQVHGVSMQGDRVAAALVANKRGSQEIGGAVFVDATGDADLAAFAGAPFEKGRKSDGQMQGVTMVFKLGGCDFTGRFYQSREDIKKADLEFKTAFERGEATRQYSVGCINRIPGMEGCVAVNTQHCFNVDATDPASLGAAMTRGRRECHEIAGLFKRHLRGFERCYLLETAPFIGIRETRRVVGDYVITKADILLARQFEDSVGRNAYNLDIHIPGEAENAAGEIFLKPGASYTMPYRALLPLGTSNLIVAGRSVSSTHEAQSSLRIMPCCMVMGQAAGTAAALAANGKGGALREVDVKTLQAQLAKDNVVL